MQNVSRTMSTCAVASILLLTSPCAMGETAGEAETEQTTNSAQAVPAPEQDGRDSNTKSNQPQEVQEQLLEQLEDGTFKPFRSLLVERQMPVLGIKWGADVQADFPINNEPSGAAPTLREARLIFYRSFGQKWSAKVQANYNNQGAFEIGDSYFVYTGWKTAGVKLGVFSPNYSLESLTSRTALTFMERALPVEALSERRSTGVGLIKRTPKSILEAGAYFLSPDQDGQKEKGQAVVLRYVHAPLEADRGWGPFGGHGIWSGFSLSYRTNAKGPNTQFRSLPEVGVVDDYFVDTGAIDGADTIIRLGLEANQVKGPFSWQAEILTAKVDRENESSTFFYGGYFFASWFLTGETRNYNPGTGVFDYVTPNSPVGNGGWGAWEVALRASTVDLNDKDVIGGQERNLTLGVNWYLNQRLRVQANLIKVLDVKRPGSQFDGEDPIIVAVRLQWYLP